jgi:hypothetical protein
MLRTHARICCLSLEQMRAHHHSISFTLFTVFRSAAVPHLPCSEPLNRICLLCSVNRREQIVICVRPLACLCACSFSLAFSTHAHARRTRAHLSGWGGQDAVHDAAAAAVHQVRTNADTENHTRGREGDGAGVHQAATERRIVTHKVRNPLLTPVSQFIEMRLTVVHDII